MKNNTERTDIGSRGELGYSTETRAIPRRTTAISVWVSVCVLLPVAVIGCGDSGPERVVVSGKISYRGNPLPHGTIRFLPAPGTKTPMTGAGIVDGRYTADKRGGVPVGTHRVVIEAFSPTHKTAGTAAAPPDDMGMGLVPKVQYLPAKYNVKTTLQITLEPGTGSTVKDFDLTD